MPDRATKWAMTVYEEQFFLLDTMPDVVAEWGWQDEVCPETKRKHRQGFLRTHTQQRFSALRKVLPGVHIEVARDWNKLLNYCRKKDTRDLSGARVFQTNVNKPMTMGETLTLLAAYLPTIKYREAWMKIEKKLYTEKDEYWYCVRAYLHATDNHNSIGLFTNPQMLCAWTNTRDYWVARHTRGLDRQTDRQAEDHEVTPAENVFPEYNGKEGCEGEGEEHEV